MQTVKAPAKHFSRGQTGRAAGKGGALTEELFWEHATPGSMRRLVLGALKCFAEKGYHGTTTRDIAKRAGLSPAALYLHYKSKADLLFAISAVVGNAMLDELRRAAEQPGTPPERLRHLVKTHVSFHAAMHTAVHVANYELHALPPKYRKQIAAIRDATEAIVHECLETGIASDDFAIADLRAVTIAILSLGISVSRWFSPGGRLSAEELGELYADLVSRMVRP
ncbi:MAG: TetR/AcrR family transcriptional regulator [Candidatus Velthaea sp.]